MSWEERYLRRNLNRVTHDRNKKQFVWRIGYVINWRGENGDELCFVFHGAGHLVLKAIFDKLKGTYLEDYVIEDEHHDRMVNGLCYWQKVVRVINPNLMNMKPQRMAEVIGILLPKMCLCKVRYFAKYEDFLNT